MPIHHFVLTLNKMKMIDLCADDFGLNPAISNGILQLAQRQRLSAVSCMVNLDSCKVYAPDLLALKDKVQIGLHFNLTEGNFVSDPKQACFSLKDLLFKSHLGLIDKQLIAKEFQAQLMRFQELMSCMPDFIDGHQHVHQFPGIRNIILEAYTPELKSNNTWIRATYPSINVQSFALKGRILGLTGGKALSQELNQRNIAHNAYFSGIYDFKPGTDYRALFRQWLQSIPNNTLIMCHPGEGGDKSDAIYQTRPVELAYLLSPEFPQDCQEFNIKFNDKPKTATKYSCK